MMEALLNLEGAILLWVQSIRTDWLNVFFTNITKLGDSGIFWIVLCVVFLFFKKTRKAGIVGLAALLIGYLLCNLALKNLVGRTRPYFTIEGLTPIIPHPGEFSFPSGHTNCSFAAAMAVHFTKRKKWTVLLVVLAAIVGISRIYVGVHYPTDVIGGVLTGTVSAYISHRLIGRGLLRKM